MLLNDVLPNYDDPMIRIHDINLLNANLAVDNSTHSYCCDHWGSW
jgi:hypothetical protein